MSQRDPQPCTKHNYQHDAMNCPDNVTGVLTPSTPNQPIHETHSCCNKRLREEGGKARCCECVPHEGCENDQPMETKACPRCTHPMAQHNKRYGQGIWACLECKCELVDMDYYNGTGQVKADTSASPQPDYMTRPVKQCAKHGLYIHSDGVNDTCADPASASPQMECPGCDGEGILPDGSVCFTCSGNKYGYIGEGGYFIPYPYGTIPAEGGEQPAYRCNACGTCLACEGSTIEAHECPAPASASVGELEPRERYHDNYTGKPEKHPIPCEDCGSDYWVDYLLPHPVFNAVCPGGNGYLCLPCFVERMNKALAANHRQRETVEAGENVEQLETKVRAILKRFEYPAGQDDIPTLDHRLATEAILTLLAQARRQAYLEGRVSELRMLSGEDTCDCFTCKEIRRTLHDIDAGYKAGKEAGDVR